MWNYRAASIRPNMILKRSLAPKLTLNHESVSLNRSLWSGNNSKPKSFLTAFGTRLLRAFDRNLKSLFKMGRCTRNSVFGSLLENRLVQVMLVDFGRSVTKSRDILLSATCLSVYNWEENSHRSEQIQDLASDISFINQLTLETLTCKSCQKRLKIDQKVPDVVYCSCSDSKPSSAELNGWKPFIERPNTLVWRKEHEIYKGLYAYKMYGRFETINAMDFLRVQLDTNFRKQWDASAIQLEIIEENVNTNTDLVYWEMRWPRPFANRDYVFKRKLTFIPKENVCVISSVATSHPEVPVKKSMHRVTEYWSYMVVKPFTNFERPGTEFVLTYFDNPGLSIPSSVSTWVAMTGLPNFVGKLHDAAGRVTDLAGPEPALMHCLRAQMDAHRRDVITSIEIEDTLTVQLPSEDEATSTGQQDSSTVQEEIFSLTVVEGAPNLKNEGDQQKNPQEEASSIVQAESTLAEDITPANRTPPTASSVSSLPSLVTNSDPVNSQGSASLGDAVKTTPPASASPTAPTSSASPSCSTASNSCSDNAQFLARSPVYC
ncbi:uncharacterized protein LOC130688653 [Daphnia carinata]|uniref:uncharacterized protein LOC130688653 n=1 Tax=Daphnia carinata TaxID=120202 RepID=UPI002580AD0A|nr:uncharacterized protein LOC130688653 [Daphnia carinata]